MKSNRFFMHVHNYYYNFNVAYILEVLVSFQAFLSNKENLNNYRSLYSAFSSIVNVTETINLKFKH